MKYSIKEIVFNNDVMTKLVITDDKDKVIYSFNDDLLATQLLEMRMEILNNSDDTSKDDLFKLRLKQAKYIALDTLYPYDLTKEDLPIRIAKDWQVRCAIELYGATKRKGIQSYSENGLSVSYLTSLISNDLMRELTPPKAGLPK